MKGKKSIKFWLEKDQYQAVKFLAFRRDTTMSDLLRDTCKDIQETLSKELREEKAKNKQE